MTSILISALLLSRLDAEADFAAFVKKHPTFKVHVEASVNGKSISVGDLLVERPERLLYKAHGAKFDYALSSTEKGYVEVENSRKLYDEYPSVGRLAVYDSDINGLAGSLVPRFLFVPSLRYVFQKPPQATAS